MAIATLRGSLGLQRAHLCGFHANCRIPSWFPHCCFFGFNVFSLLLSSGLISYQLSTVLLLHNEALPEERLSPARLHEAPELQFVMPVLLLQMGPASPSTPLGVLEVETHVWMQAVE